MLVDTVVGVAGDVVLVDTVVVVAGDVVLVDTSTTDAVSSRGDASGADSLLLLHAATAVKAKRPTIAPTRRRSPRPEIKQRSPVMAASSVDSARRIAIPSPIVRRLPGNARALGP